MAVLDFLASSQGKKGNEANIALAKDIASSNNKKAIKELVDNLNNSNKNIQSDCIKTFYETAYLKPELIADYYGVFIELLKSKNNRLVWGSMIALATITDLRAKEIFSSLDLIMQTIEKGSVITIDSGIEILAKLNKYSEYFDTTDPILLEQLWKCPIKQLPMYIEKSLISINKKNKEAYQNIIVKRKTECAKDSQNKRLDKVLKHINNI